MEPKFKLEPFSEFASLYRLITESFVFEDQVFRLMNIIVMNLTTLSRGSSASNKKILDSRILKALTELSKECEKEENAVIIDEASMCDEDKSEAKVLLQMPKLFLQDLKTSLPARLNDFYNKKIKGKLLGVKSLQTTLTMEAKKQAQFLTPDMPIKPLGDPNHLQRFLQSKSNKQPQPQSLSCYVSSIYPAVPKRKFFDIFDAWDYSGIAEASGKEKASNLLNLANQIVTAFREYGTLPKFNIPALGKADAPAIYNHYNAAFLAVYSDCRKRLQENLRSSGLCIPPDPLTPEQKQKAINKVAKEVIQSGFNKALLHNFASDYMSLSDTLFLCEKFNVHPKQIVGLFDALIKAFENSEVKKIFYQFSPRSQAEIEKLGLEAYLERKAELLPRWVLKIEKELASRRIKVDVSFVNETKKEHKEDDKQPISSVPGLRR